MSNIKLLYIDLFCGAGGTSTGVERATFLGEKCAKVIACVDHDANAIASHAANHPDALHFTEDIRTLELSPLIEYTRTMQKKYPNTYLVLWASLECTNFSKAKGGMPRDANSRSLAEHLLRYIKTLRPNYIQIENVEEFMSWGDMDENGHPISKDKGKSYVRWVNNVCKYGYYFDWRILNAADYGAYTSRKRFFGQFALHGLPIAFPKATYAKCPAKYEHSLFPADNMKPWKPVREVIDLNDEGESIFGRKKPLVEKTLKRIYDGLIKFVAGNKKVFIMNPQYTCKGSSIDNPCFTLIARMDKMPPYLISTKEGLAIEVYETDNPATIQIKEFMAQYGIADICMRILRISELKRIMGFPKDYTLIGTQAEQKKFIGNAVEVNMSKVLCEALAKKLSDLK